MLTGIRCLAVIILMKDIITLNVNLKSVFVTASRLKDCHVNDLKIRDGLRRDLKYVVVTKIDFLEDC